MQLKTNGTISRIASCFLATLVVCFLAVGLIAQDERLKTINTRLDTIRIKLDQIEGVLAAPDQRRRTLLALRDEIDPLRQDALRFSDELAPRLAEVESRLKELGATRPDPGSENPTFANERKAQSALQKELDAALRQSRLLTVRADQLGDRIERQQRALFTNRLFARVYSLIDPSLWMSAVHAIPFEALSFRYVAAEWRDHAIARAGISGMFLALLAAAGAAALIYVMRHTVRSRLFHVRKPDKTPLTLLQKSQIALRDAILNSAAAPLATLAAIETLSAFELLTESTSRIAYGFLAAVIFVSAGRGLARAVLAPHDARLRLPILGDKAAHRLHSLISNTVLVTSTILFTNVIHRTLSAPAAMTVFTSAIYGLVIALLVAYALITHQSQSSTDEHTEDLPPWIRLTGWTATAIILIALFTGFIRFAAFLADRLAMAAVVLTALYLGLALIDALMGRGLAEESGRRRAVASTLGVKTKTLDLIATLVAGFLRALLFVFAAFLVIGTLTTSAIDIAGTLDRVALGVEIGRTKILFADVLAAVLILIIGFVFARIVHRWIGNSVLPRTDLEPGLQNSIATIVGYASVIITISLALGRLGLNLENVALVAGALSVGIGFGLQAIVSNFVSGLILLTERPIRVGDWIVAKGEEGIVKKISVRSTEIETFERATVILPNSDLITSSVKNWTHSNKLGRVVVPVGVSYDADPDKIREILLAIASGRSEFLRNPAPHVLFTKFGDNALEFELRGVIGDINQRLSVTSEINFEIFRRFRQEGIDIPFPQRVVRILSDSAGGHRELEDHVKPVQPKNA
jgi:potassium-dependent mechanosensitive channel